MANIITNPTADQTIQLHNLLPASGNTSQSLGSSAAPWNAALLQLNGGTVICLTGTGDPYGGLIQNAINALPSAGGVIDARAAGVAAVHQATIDAGSNSKYVTILFGPYSHTVTQFVLWSNTIISGAGNVDGTIINAFSASTDLFVLPTTTPVAGIKISDVQLAGTSGNASQRCFNFIAAANCGIWYSVFERITIITSFARNVCDIQAQTSGSINQFLSFRDVTVYSSGTGSALNIEGMCGQFLFDNCSFQINYSSGNTNTNINIQSAGSSSFPQPYNMDFNLLSCQGAMYGMQIAGCVGIVVRNSHFELNQNGIVVASGDGAPLVVGG